jgi:hypothetical protein
MSDSDDYGNVSRNLRGCFPVTITSFLVGVIAAMSARRYPHRRH